MLAKSPGFAAAAVFALALGIGANATIFSLLDSMVFHPLPFAAMDRLVAVWESVHTQGNDRNEAAPANFLDWKSEQRSFERMAVYTGWDANIAGTEVPVRVQGFRVSADFFDTVGARPLLGRTFLSGEDEPGKDGVAILSYGVWQRLFAGDRDIIGKTILLNGASRAVVGVMPNAYNYPPAGEVWVPLPLTAERVHDRQSHYLLVVARLKPGVSLQEARADLDVVAGRLARAYPSDNADRGVNLMPLAESVTGHARPILFLMLGAVAFFLLIACANVANLLLARGAARQREIAIRVALGASRFRLIRQMLTESALLGVLGGAMGLLLAFWGLRLLAPVIPAEFARYIPGWEEVAINRPVLFFTLALSIGTAILFGLAPALRFSRPDANEALKEGSRSSGGAAKSRLRNSLVISELALSLVLLIGAGLLMKSFVELQHVNTGFNPAQLLTARISLPIAKYPTPQNAGAFYDQLLERVKGISGVEAAGLVDLVPLEGENHTQTIRIEGRPEPPPGQEIEPSYRCASSSYFGVMQIPVQQGRVFSADDTPESPLVVIVNQTMARRYWPQGDALGKRIRFVSAEGPIRWRTIVGIIPDVREELDRAPNPEVFLPLTQVPSYNAVLVLRARVDAASMTAAVRTAVQSLDKNQPIFSVMTMEELRSFALLPQRIPRNLMAIFAGLALLLAATGIYGVISYSVQQQTREIGIRMALGAERRDVLRHILGQGIRLTGIGLAAGLVAGIGVARLLSGILFGVSAVEPAIFSAVALLLGAVALAACIIPARRAMRVDPMVALRYE